MAELDHVAAFSRMFSAAAIKPLASSGRSALVGRLLQTAFQSRTAFSKHDTVGDALEAAFDILMRLGHRDDHVYRSAVAQKLFLGRHTSNTAAVMFEARASRSRADVVILNGTSTAYEIKSERDSFARLHDQLQDYRQLWASVNVVTAPNRVGEALTLSPPDVGVISLTSRFTLESVRPATNDPSRINPLLLLDSMRASDAIAVVERLGGSVPELPNTKLRSYLADCFNQANPRVVHQASLAVIKSNRAQHEVFEIARRLPIYLRAPALALSFNGSALQNLHRALATPVLTAQQWSS